MIETRDAAGRVRVFSDWAAVDGHFVSLSAEQADADQHTYFPDGLQIAHFQRCRGGDSLPPLPLSITSVSFSACQITRWDHLVQERHTALESMSFTDCILSSLDGQWPPNLVHLSCKGNRLLHIRSDFPPQLGVLDLSYNLFRFPPLVCQSAPLGLTVLFAPNVNCFRDPQKGRRLVQSAIVSSGQSVHASSVQDSLSESVRVIMQHPCWGRTPNTLMDRVWFGFRLRKEGEEKALLNDIRTKLGDRVHDVAKQAVTRRTVHSRAGITYSKLLSHVWGLAMDNTNIREVVGAEILAGEGYCFTGQFSRLVNSLTGFVDGVGVQLSEAESLGNKLARVISHLQAKYPASSTDEEQQACYEQDAQTAMVVVFTEEGTPEDQWNSWLAGI